MTPNSEERRIGSDPQLRITRPAGLFTLCLAVLLLTACSPQRVAVNLIGDGVRDLLDPKMRGRR